MRILILVIFLLAILSFAFAEENTSGAGGHDIVTEGFTIPPAPASNGCDAMYEDTVNVRALDGKSRPIEGASVRLRYQIDKSTGKGYFTTLPRLTGKDGNASFAIKNLENNPANVDCTITISVSLDGRNFTNNIKAQNHPTIIDFNLDVYSLRVVVTDEKNSAINGALVFVNNRNKTTVNGISDFKVFKGDTRIFVKYLDGKEEKEVSVNNDLITSIQLTFYKLKIFTTDDKESPLKTSVTIDDKEYETDGSGQLKIDKIVGQYHSVVIKYQGREKKLDLNLVENSEYNIAFDLAPPKINDIKVLEEANKLRVLISTSDEGKFASGISASDVNVLYITENGGTKKVAVYQSKPSQYSAEIPVAQGLTEISFTVDIKDKDGNKVSAEGTHKLGTSDQNNNTNNTNSNNSGNNGETGDSTGNDTPPSSNVGVPLHYIVGGIIILAVVFYAVYRLKFKKEG